LDIHLNKNMNFKKNKYIIIKEAISKDLAKFCYDYFMMKKQVARTMFDTRYISQFTEYFGVWNDQQVPETYSHYSDIVMETLLLKLLPVMEKETELKLNSNYSYARIYKKGDILHRHKDRFSCEISTTLNLGGDSWPIYLEPSGKEGSKGIKVDLKPGEMLVYRGNELEHWRESFKGENCAQVFLHYNDIKTKGSKENIYDKRPHLGLPAWFKK
tara:strand:+ start:916 stop:1557 length:642 start_codon:yes stop_codon:yes gene_type:complete